ncbi:MFS transporter [Serinibacter salmoneus]|uniref:Putative MFS family arabinose efflux permease n=1 Tax=Serinibacter salmoneus TaxID=556530 RepID=A0A2A9D3N4_9MICO|nr:MFS transporter [Serinibacter salmoneus]PFG20865.1 putative MFS family arabinose efflux permease [Serinibacter salmoneus]
MTNPLTRAGRWLEPWFAAYALAGLLVNALVPMLIPLSVESHGPTAVALVISAFFAGQLTAPAIGSYADRAGKQRVVFLGAFPAMATSAIGFGLADSVPLWALAALAAGVSAGAAQTTGSVFIVEGHPREEWDVRIGWFRLTFGLGQVAGLAIGAVFADGRVNMGWYVGGAVIAFGVLLGRIGLPRVSAPAKGHHRVPVSGPPSIAAHLRHPRDGERHPSGLRTELRGPFGRFLLTWLLAMIAVQTILNVMPLVMDHAFKVTASHTATYYLIGSLAGALLYPVCGSLAARTTAARVLGIGMLITLAGFAVMTATWALALPGEGVLGPIGLVLIAIGYPFDYVGGTMLAAELTLDGQGSAMGLFNSAVAAGAIVGAIAPSFLATALGYGALPPLAAAIMVLAMAVGFPLLRRTT